MPSVESTAAAGWGGVKPLSPGGVTAPALHRVPEVRVCWCQPCTGTVFAWGRLNPVPCRLLGARPVPPGDTAGFLGGLPISPVSCLWGCSGHAPLQQPPSTHITGVPEPPLHHVPAVGTAAFPPLRGWPGPVPSLPHRRVLQACGTAAASAFGVGWGLGWAPLPPAAGSVRWQNTGHSPCTAWTHRGSVPLPPLLCPAVSPHPAPAGSVGEMWVRALSCGCWSRPAGAGPVL